MLQFVWSCEFRDFPLQNTVVLALESTFFVNPPQLMSREEEISKSKKAKEKRKKSRKKLILLYGAFDEAEISSLKNRWRRESWTWQL